MKNSKRKKRSAPSRKRVRRRLAVACIGAGCLLILGVIYAVNELIALAASGGVLIAAGFAVDVD